MGVTLRTACWLMLHWSAGSSPFCLTCASCSKSKPGCSGYVMLICSLIRDLQRGDRLLRKDIDQEGLLSEELYLSYLSLG